MAKVSITIGPAGATAEIDLDLFLRKYSGEAESGPGYQYLREEICRVQNRNRARKRKGEKGPLRDAIERICEDLENPTLETVLSVFDDEDAMLDLQEAVENPINIMVQEVAHHASRVYYRTRAGKEKDVSFKQISELIRKAR